MKTILVISSLFLLAFIVILCLLLSLSKKVKRLQGEKENLLIRNKELEQKMTQTEGDTVTYKLNPHLFKNALNAIQSHAYQSYYALDKLSNVLDYILYESADQYVTLAEEIEFALSLIEINRLKTSPLFNLHVKNKISRDSISYQKGLIAPLITINPIENAFKHVDLQQDNAFISIVLNERDGWFELAVSNSMSPHEQEENLPAKGGIGNATFHKRLKAIYGEHYDYNESVGNGIYTTSLKIKLLEDYA